MYNYCFFHECNCKVTCSVFRPMYAYVTCSSVASNDLWN
jgi:hypothetical protein